MMLSLTALTALGISSFASAGVSRSEAEQVFARLLRSPTAKQSIRQNLRIVPSDREEVSLWQADGVTISDGFLRRRSEAEVAWALARHISHELKDGSNYDSPNRFALSLYREAGYDPFWPAATQHRLTPSLQRLCPDWELAALALEQTYHPQPYPGSDRVKTRATPTLGHVEHIWNYTDPGWVEWFRTETGLSATAKNRFEAGQCTALAYAIRPDFPFDKRGGGRNDAKNWLSVAKAAGQKVWSFPSYLAIGVQDAWNGNSFGHVFIYLGETEDGRIRAIDCNFGRQPDGKVRVRVFEPDSKILGYIWPPEEWRASGRLNRPLRPNQTVLTNEQPFWHARLNGYSMTGADQYSLRLRVRATTARHEPVELLMVTSLSETATTTITPTAEWQTVEIGSLLQSGGGESIPFHHVHSVMVIARAPNVALEISNPTVVER